MVVWCWWCSSWYMGHWAAGSVGWENGRHGPPEPAERRRAHTVWWVRGHTGSAHRHSSLVVPPLSSVFCTLQSFHSLTPSSLPTATNFCATSLSHSFSFSFSFSSSLLCHSFTFSLFSFFHWDSVQWLLLVLRCLKGTHLRPYSVSESAIFALARLFCCEFLHRKESSWYMLSGIVQR